MKNLIGIVFLFSFIVLFGHMSYAQTSDVNDGQTMLDISNDELYVLVEEHIANIIGNDDSYNVIGDLQLSEDFARSRMTTFSEAKNFSGEGRVGTQIGVTVFSFDEQDGVQVNQRKSVIVGMSRLFNESIDLSNIGDNYILIVTKSSDQNDLKYAIYNIVRLEEEKKVELENVKINFFNSSIDSSKGSKESFFERFNQMR